jgi:hypothetical protein
MNKEINEEYEKTVKKRDEIKKLLQSLEAEKPKDHYNITINRDRISLLYRILNLALYQVGLYPCL